MLRISQIHILSGENLIFLLKFFLCISSLRYVRSYLDTGIIIRPCANIFIFPYFVSLPERSTGCLVSDSPNNFTGVSTFALNLDMKTDLWISLHQTSTQSSGTIILRGQVPSWKLLRISSETGVNSYSFFPSLYSQILSMFCGFSSYPPSLKVSRRFQGFVSRKMGELIKRTASIRRPKSLLRPSNSSQVPIY